MKVCTSIHTPPSCWRLSRHVGQVVLRIQRGRRVGRVPGCAHELLELEVEAVVGGGEEVVEVGHEGRVLVVCVGDLRGDVGGGGRPAGMVATVVVEGVYSPFVLLLLMLMVVVLGLAIVGHLGRVSAVLRVVVWLLLLLCRA